MINGRMYVFGGQVPGGAGNELWVYDPAPDSWSKITPPGAVPPARSFYAVAQSGYNLWIFGGQGRDGTILNDTWEFNTTTGAWTRKTDMPLALAGAQSAALTPGVSSNSAGAGAASSDSVRILLFGGRNGVEPTNRTFYYYPTGKGAITPQYLLLLGD